MSEERRDFSVQKRDYIIEKIIKNPEITGQEIKELTGLDRQKQEKEIVEPWIKENTLLVFGEKFKWHSVNLRSKRNSPTRPKGFFISPDLVGKDCNGRPVIVEVKLKFDIYDNKKSRNNPRTDREHKSVGQIVQYKRVRTQCDNSLAYLREYPSTQVPRLFIVSIDHSPDVEAVCEFLKEFNIDIKHIAIKNILSK